jgi:hypothetical protein
LAILTGCAVRRAAVGLVARDPAAGTVSEVTPKAVLPSVQMPLPQPRSIPSPEWMP